MFLDTFFPESLSDLVSGGRLGHTDKFVVFVSINFLLASALVFGLLAKATTEPVEASKSSPEHFLKLISKLN